MGVKHWVQFYQGVIPQFEVFKFVGRNLDTGIYFFQSLRSKKIISKGLVHLNPAFGFKPFVINRDEIDSFLKNGGRPL